MKLSDLLAYNQIVIQCHDNPDADALASGFGVYRYLKLQGKKDVRFVYSGPYPIQKSNLLLMVSELEIPIDYVMNLEKPELLVLVDCQYGQGNVRRFDAEQVVVIDHHQITGPLPSLCQMENKLASCSTIVWDMLGKEGIDVNSDKKLATALYYGLLRDSNNFTEISQSLDRKLRDEATYDSALIHRFRNANLSLNELAIAGQALLNYDYDPKYRLALVGAEPCDPNVLGLISDLVLEVDVVDTALVYSVLPFGIKFSIRSCVSQVNANKAAAALANGIGSGGGHKAKAGGFLQKELYEKSFSGNQFLKERMESYLEECMRKDFAGKGTIIFDLDGTLLDTLQDLYLAVNAALEAYHMPARTIDEVRQFVGNGVQKLMERSVPNGLANPQFEEAYDFFRDYYAKHCKENTKPYDGIYELLEALRKMGKKTAIVSNKMDPAVKILQKELFEGMIDVALGESERCKKKPAPDMVREALKELKVNAADAIYVGDSDVDIATALNSGLPCVSVTWGFRDAEFLTAKGARCLIDKPTELLKLL